MPSAPATPAPAPPTAYQESVITNTEFVETKQTKKRKAVSAANSMNTPVDYTSPTPPTGVRQIAKYRVNGYVIVYLYLQVRSLFQLRHNTPRASQQLCNPFTFKLFLI